MNKSTLLTALLLLLPTFATAQWQWIDANGIRVFSDRAPPVTVPANKIIQRPKALSVDYAVTPVDAQAVDAAGKASPQAKDPAKVDPAEAEAQRRMRAEQDRADAARVENCRRAKEAKRPYDAGIRVSRLNAKGEREFLDDTQRQVEATRLQGIIDSECAPLPKAKATTPAASPAS